MAVWKTTVSHFSENEGDSSIEHIDVEIVTDLQLSWETTKEFQKLAWQAARETKPEWIPEGHVSGFVKTGSIDCGTLTMLSHEYRKVS